MNTNWILRSKGQQSRSSGSDQLLSKKADLHQVVLSCLTNQAQ